jgi:lipid-A-disaccharide synthase
MGLVNLINDEPLVTELVQDDASAVNIAAAVDELISNPAGLKKMRERLYEIREKLGGSGASGKVADIALELIERGYHGQPLT